jgi:hypothetical protein
MRALSMNEANAVSGGGLGLLAGLTLAIPSLLKVSIGAAVSTSSPSHGSSCGRSKHC